MLNLNTSAIHLLYKKPLVHLTFWCAFILYEVLTVIIFSGEPDPWYDYAGHYLINISLFYFSALLVFPCLAKKKRLLLVPAMILIAFTAYLLLKSGLLSLFRALELPYYNPYTGPESFIAASFWRGLTFFNMGFFYWLFSSYVDKMAEIGQLNLKRVENEKNIIQLQLAKIQSQVNPHFLFNTLNLIHSRALKEHSPIAHVIETLADVLEHTFRSPGEDGKVPLEDEIKQIELYTELNRLRHRNFNVKVLIEGKPYGIRIPPMLLVSITENLFKFGDLANEEAATIELKIRDDGLRFRTFNIKSGNKSIKSHKTGMIALKQRLELYYSGKYELSVDDQERTFELKLSILLN